jgi:hypothetical protein
LAKIWKLGKIFDAHTARDGAPTSMGFRWPQMGFWSACDEVASKWCHVSKSFCKVGDITSNLRQNHGRGSKFYWKSPKTRTVASVSIFVAKLTFSDSFGSFFLGWLRVNENWEIEVNGHEHGWNLACVIGLIPLDEMQKILDVGKLSLSYPRTINP